MIRFGAAGALGLLAVTEVAWAVGMAPLLGILTADGPSPVPFAPLARIGITAALFAGFSLAVAALTAVSAVGVATGSRYGWWAGLVGALLWLPTGCVPGSLVALVILLLPEVRALAFPPPPPEPARG